MIQGLSQTFTNTSGEIPGSRIACENNRSISVFKFTAKWIKKRIFRRFLDQGLLECLEKRPSLRTSVKHVFSHGKNFLKNLSDLVESSVSFRFFRLPHGRFGLAPIDIQEGSLFDRIF